MGVPQFKALRRAYGFDEVAIAPGHVTINPDQTNIQFSIDGVTLKSPVIASAMDAIVNPAFAVEFGKLGGLAVMNMEGVQARYDNPQEVIDQIVAAPPENVTALFQKLYSAPIKEDLLAKRVKEIKAGGAVCAVSVTPANTKKLAPIAVDAGADLLCVQSTVTTARHVSKSVRGLVFSELLEMVNIPVIVGNCVAYDVALELMETGVHGVLVGVGPGAACTTREVTGVGVPQVTATMDCAAAREEYYRRTGRYVPIITDGGIRTGGDLCKAFASGADAVMIGTPFAQTKEAPGKGYNWGMATPHPVLPRGTRVKPGVKTTLQQLMYGPTSKHDGTQNLMGALQVCMGMVGAFNIRDFHEKAELIIAPSIKTEGKHYQLGLE
ncbi:MAG: GuaB3 family IMP dehydrogenase-related protein [SAR202 cluster bacterium]|nr:GuaB3 family IMP dehydrogenase-related protein [SAR202 cluster bacterium]